MPIAGYVTEELTEELKKNVDVFVTPIPDRFCGGDSLRRGAISSVCTFTFSLRSG